ncbi:PfkB family carbohydrate kinase [Sorangium sp. So ce1036]|uniref:PfkB family carbohydrate kinase n=1 Tax=Sorangium sp. So ce1036 TaxID=3133328 RepID=UPI003EFC5A5F
MAHPDILLIGHVTCDLSSADPQSDHRLGGTVSFAAVTAVRLGRAPTIITRAAPSTDLSGLPAEAEVRVLPSPTTTTFANVYTEQGRVQTCYARALPITANDIDGPLRRPRAVLLGPLVNEIGPDVAGIFDDTTLVVAVPQGWMRRWDDTGRVYSKRWDDVAEVLPFVDVLVLSQEDIDHDLSRLEPFFEHVPLVVLTESRDGSTLYRRLGRGAIVETKVPPREAQEIDPTGAGDIFATAFMIRLQETGDPVQSARFANVTASFGVERVGMAGIPSREEVLAYMREHPFPATGDRVARAHRAAHAMAPRGRLRDGPAWRRSLPGARGRP